MFHFAIQSNFFSRLFKQKSSVFINSSYNPLLQVQQQFGDNKFAVEFLSYKAGDIERRKQFIERVEKEKYSLNKDYCMTQSFIILNEIVSVVLKIID